MKRLIILLLTTTCGVALSQFPEFAQQYRQRLGGAVDELSKIVIKFDAAAEKASLTREQALSQYAQTNSDFLKQQGGDMRGVITRYQYLKSHQSHLTDAAQFERLLVFAKERDAELSKATYDAFEPAVPATPEGLAHGGAGLLGGWALFSILLMPFGRRRRRR